MKALLGTPYYIAPEILLKGNYGVACDLWSLGVVMYVLLTGVPPFFGNSNKEIFEAIKTGKFDINLKPFLKGEY